MKLPASRCSHCGSIIAARELADDEVCNCSSRSCLIRSAQLCVTTNQPRTGTFRTSERETKSPTAPPRDRMLTVPSVRK